MRRFVNFLNTFRQAGYEAGYGAWPGYEPRVQLDITSPIVAISISTVPQNTKDHHNVNFKHNNTKI